MEKLRAIADWIVSQAELLWDEAMTIWLAGGWAMIVIAAIAMVMFTMGMVVHFRLRDKGFQRVPERTWRRWIEHPEERHGPVGELLDFVTGGRSIADTTEYFKQLRITENTPLERDLRVMRICVSAAPLVGLLGTVTGMLSTFSALATGSGGDQTMGLVAAGISEALVTTETGLVIALPGLFFQAQLARRFACYQAFLAHLETVCTQSLRRRSIAEDRRRRAEQVRRSIAERILGRAKAAKQSSETFTIDPQQLAAESETSTSLASSLEPPRRQAAAPGTFLTT